jgi:hypothetical protein
MEYLWTMFHLAYPAAKSATYGEKLRAADIRTAARTASDTVTAMPFAKPLIPNLGKTMKRVANNASAAAVAAMWAAIEDISS